MKNPIKAAIIYLANSAPKYIADLKLSLSSLDVNFNDQFRYPVIIFHRDFSEALIQDIRKATRSNTRFEKVKFEIPDFLNKAEIPERCFGFDIEYRHMCRFFSGLVYRHPGLKDYDWYWRLDTDSFLLSKIDYDVFYFMQKHNYMYGYITMLKDRPETVKGLWDLTKKYIRENKIQPTFLHKFTLGGVWNRTIYYTNFEIGKLDFWHSEKFISYFNYLDRSGGIYKYRWGDTPIHSLAIYMFIPEKQVHQFSDIAYKHQSFVNQPSRFKLLILLRKNIFYANRWLGSKTVLVKFYLKLKKFLGSFCK
ncbi:MAG: hypothetical protein AUK06_00285 [Parcubacteria group bacterium CG2_30_36_18]|uniref:Glycosyl transferase n=1 Tax=Candidatus Nealsonbacteria bacterium CG_4_9_14_0_8_um_filter_36_17 TaxID=1974693 RepID=A0A2M8DLF6_9BACT|nr:MAG: hypothetical protein AUK06_00285 [Parcubacteria group bacterium CG2_30_36_18]PJB98647.1 MAG: hypothetical protein CO078_01285 [Candidatus Nealsonbacteria bacterium CG_4_9_14_0_8_um_filter_36_17]